jgi:hypothetical protein
MSNDAEYTPETDRETDERWKPRVSVVEVDFAGVEKSLGLYHFQHLPRVGESVILQDYTAFGRYHVVEVEHHPRESGRSKIVSPEVVIKLTFVKFDKITE